MLEILQNAALKGGEVLKSYFRKNLTPVYKTTHQNLVTEADIKSQQTIHDYLLKEMTMKLHISESDIGFIGEENLYKPGKYLFAIDPLDGTANFATRFEYFAVSIGVFVDGVLTYGVIYEPIQDAMYFAEKGKGTYKKERNVKTRVQIVPDKLEHMYLSGGLGTKEELRRRQFEIYNKLFPHFRSYLFIYAGCPSMCLVMENIVGVFFAGGPGIWDIAAGKLLIEEAEGIMVNWEGKEMVFDLTDPDKRYPFMVCHPKNLPIILNLLNPRS